MDFVAALSRALAIARLDRRAIRETGADPDASLPALIIVAIAGALASTGATLFLIGPAAIGSMIVGAFVALPLALVGVVLVHLSAHLLGARGELEPLARALGHGAGFAAWVSVVPLLGGLAALGWSLAVSIVVVSELRGAELGRASLIVLLPIGLLMLLSIASALLVALLALALGALGGHFG